MFRKWRTAAYVALLIVILSAMVAPTTTRAKDGAEIDALNRQVAQLLDEGKLAEAAPIAQRTLTLAERVLGRDHPGTLAAVNNLSGLHFRRGHYSEAEPLLKRAVVAKERVLGKDHPDTLASLRNLASLYRAQGRYGDAESLLKRVMNAQERRLGKEHQDTLASVHELAVLYKSQGRYSEAEVLLKRAVETLERVLGREHPHTLMSVFNLAALYENQGRYDEAEPLAKRALEARERVLGKEHHDTLNSVNNLAVLYFAKGRYAEAEPLYKHAIAAHERSVGEDHPDTLASVNNLAALYYVQGRQAEAEPLLKRMVEASERVFGKENPRTLLAISNLAILYAAQGRYGEAEPLYKRALEGRERVLGSEHPDTLASVHGLATAYISQRRYFEAMALSERALFARERVLGGEHPDTLSSISNLATLYSALGNDAKAGPLCKRAMEVSERILGREHPNTLTIVDNLGGMYYSQSRFGEAEPLFKRVVESRTRVLGKEHPSTLGSVNNLAVLYFEQRNLSQAAEFWRRSTAGIAARTQRGASDAGQAATGKRKSEAEQLSWQFVGLVKAVYRLASHDAAALREMFQTAQWALTSDAALSLAQVAARGATGNAELAALVRERQDLLAEWQKLDAWRNAVLAQVSGKRDANAEAANLARLNAIDMRIAAIDKRLVAEFPDYAAFANPAPLSVNEVQAHLGSDEALELILDTDDRFHTVAPSETFIWVVTKSDVRWVRSDLGTDALAREVQALRCGLDEAAWMEARCDGLSDQSFTKADVGKGKQLPFDHARAHKLYKALFGQLEDLIQGKHLLLVPSGPLTQLPFQVLVTAPPADNDHKSAAWLTRSHVLTVLPAVSSLKALRGVARRNNATKPLIGFGNPLLDGPDNRHIERAKLARDNQQCRTPALLRPVRVAGRNRGVAPFNMRGGLASPAIIRALSPLPETADELCAVARSMNVDTAEVRLGARATEREVKRLSASGQLAQYRIVHFSTHGAMAGELQGSTEPGLILTPPAIGTQDDDGYLTASEIAALKLDADWVILSACNTAAGEATGAQALSGLARAFIFAQTRALLVSHWAVNSDATVRLITTIAHDMASDSKLARSHALRQAMLAFIDKGSREEAHPAFWAPFIVVGEGGR